jgi:two-component sensor histidine kinase
MMIKNSGMKIFEFSCKLIATLVCIICCNFLSANAQSLKDMSPEVLRSKLFSANDVNFKIQILHALSKYYIAKQNVSTADLDTAISFNKEATTLSQKMRDDKAIGISILINGQIYQKQENYSKALSQINAALLIFNKGNYKEQCGEAYVVLAENYADIGPTIDSRIAYYKQAIAMFNVAEANERMADIYMHVADCYFTKGDYNESLRLLQQALAIYRTTGYKDLAQIYGFIGLTYFKTDDIVNAYKYELMAMKSAEMQHDTSSNVAQIYNSAGVICSKAHKFDSAYVFYGKGLEIAKKNRDTVLIKDCYYNMIAVLPSMGKGAIALKLLKELDKSYSFKDNNEKSRLEFMYVYNLMNEKLYDAAEPHLQKMLSLYDAGAIDAESRANTLFAAIRYYFKTGQYEKAKEYLKKRETSLELDNGLLSRADNELWWFQIDSAQARYPSAIAHYQIYKVLSDSLNSTEKLKQFNELQIQYSTEKKDKNIQLLTKKNILQDVKLQKERFVRNGIIAGLITVLLLAGLIYNRYRLKQRTNILLEKKQEEINDQNALLKRVLGEKEWLLREIHHRVKNNLQIVISLLNTQSAYLDNEDALLAIRNSQHRMHAMSLIHQKLYQSENLASIDMQWYIHELVGYMRESFDTDKRIEFTLDVDKVELDVAQAVPLGLILNEAISNAIKYAFPDKKRGNVCISLKNKDDKKCLLTIADNGIGLPLNFDLDNSESLGMSLMKGLSDQIDGCFSVQTHNGCIIQTQFEIHQELMSAEEDLNTTKQKN